MTRFMTCLDPTQVELFVHGGLSDEGISQLEEHLNGCDSCLAHVARVAGAVRSRQVSVPNDLPQTDSTWMHVMAALARSSGGFAAPAIDDRVPAQIGPYRILDVLGRGAMGVVYRAAHQESGQPAAIKTVLAPGAASLAAMRQEIAFLKRQVHPGIVHIFDDGVVDGDPWYAMELLVGRTLADLRQTLWRASTPSTSPSARRSDGDSRPMPMAAAGRLDEVLELVIRLCEPLSFVHRLGVVHCDLKPANVFLREGEQPVLMDFGLLSKAGGTIGRESLEVGGYLRGTLPYLSPEVIRGHIPDARADLYSLGCILYELVTGRTPFVASTAAAFVAAHLHAEIVPASQIASGVPPKLDAILAGLLAKRPEQRIGDAGLVAAQLASLVRGQDSQAPQTDSTPYLFRPRLVGRDAVVEQIRQLRDEAAQNRGRLVFINGESGIGKTFLGSEVARLAARAGFEVVTGECTPFVTTEQEVSVPALGPFRNLIQRAADRSRGVDPGTVPPIFGSRLTLQVLSRFEPSLKRFLGDEVRELPQLPPPAERERMLGALHELLQGMAGPSPVLIMIDDLQWADDLSLSFLESISSDFLADKRVLVVALYRSEELSEAITKIQARPGVSSIPLNRLDLPAVSSLVGDLLSGSPPAEFVQALARHSEGNPFFVAEYLRAAASEGLLSKTTEGWSLAQGASSQPVAGGDLSFPRSLRDLLERRLGLMSEGAQRAAEAASILGREFQDSLLAAMTESAPGPVSTWIDEMLKRQLAERVSPDRVRFAHDKIRESAYARIDADRRRRLHRAAAHLMEATYRETAELRSRYAELAYHFRYGGEPARATGYFEKAAEQALGESANADAVRFFEEAIAASKTAPGEVAVERRATWERRIGDALQGLGDLSGSKEHLLQAVTLLGWPLPKTQAGMAVGIMRKVVQQVLHRNVPSRWLAARARKEQARLEAARAYDRLMQIYYYLGEYQPLFYANLTTLNLAERVAPSPSLVAAYTNAAAVAGIVPNRKLASLYFRLAESTLEKAYDPEVESYYRLLYAHYLSGLGEWTGASDAANRGLELATQLGFRRRWEDGAAVRCNLGWGRDFDECLMWGERMLASASARGDTQMTSWGLLRRAEVQTARREYEAADTTLAQAERIVPQLGLPEQIRALGLRAFLVLKSGRIDEAVTAADRAAELVRQAKTIHAYCLDPYARIAEVHLAAWAKAGRSSRQVAAKARASCATLRSAARIFPIAVPRYCLHEGTRRLLAARPKSAAAIWNRGLEAARSLTIPYDEAFLLLAMATHGANDSNGVGDGVTHARRELQRLGVRDTANEARV